MSECVPNRRKTVAEVPGELLRRQGLDCAEHALLRPIVIVKQFTQVLEVHDAPLPSFLAPALRNSATTKMTVPSMIATSAMLNTPVRTGPTPTFRKSTTLPWATRSTQFDAPPARNSANPSPHHLSRLRLTATTARVNSITPVATVKNVVLSAGGQLAPRLKKPPEFSTYPSRTVSARYEWSGFPESIVVAACFVARSQPIVATIAIVSTTQPATLIPTRRS